METMLSWLILLVLGVGVLVLGVRRQTRLLADRVRALEHRVADSSKRLLSSEGQVARLRELVNAWKDSPVRSAEQPVPGAPPVEEAPPTGPEPSALPEQTRDATAPAMPPQPVPFKPPPRPASIPVAAWAPPAWVEAARSWLFGGNTVVRVGVVVLFFGVAFFLNYAADQGWFPIGLRLSGAALAGLGLLAVGWNLRDSRREYALTLQGGGVGIVYLTAFAAVNVYDLIGVGVGLGVMVVLVVLGAVLAVTQDARGLAVLATLGGFLGPVLVSRDASHVALFSYYAALDAGIVTVAWFRAWRVLNLLGFVFTFIVGAMWGFEFYQPQYFGTTQPFLALFSYFSSPSPCCSPGVSHRVSPGTWTGRSCSAYRSLPSPCSIGSWVVSNTDSRIAPSRSRCFTRSWPSRPAGVSVSRCGRWWNRSWRSPWSLGR